MAVAIALSIVGALNIYQGTPKSDSYSLWKAGKAPRGQTYQGSTALLQGAFIALLFIGIRVIYTLVAVCTQQKDLSPVTASIAVRVVFLFLPEVFAALAMITVGLRARHLQELKLATGY
ncbi:integral membrane protein [Penicillium samsonianum]|uniref:uncharacterized protein n=1 Tax=Penicillium samsonianum TaxID=1882272 RepID=UPI0025486F41|nr:uncharacterized protein N7471_013647 [Penicillium samsonianum]KAJ6119027.1 integral membrane protein [Penicillium samsonianum]